MVTYIYIHANFIVYLPCLFPNPLPLQVEVFTNPDNVSLAVVDFEVGADNLTWNCWWLSVATGLMVMSHSMKTLKM